MEQCQCLTAKGQQCLRKAISGSNYCKQHATCQTSIGSKIQIAGGGENESLERDLTEAEFSEAIANDDASFLSKYNLNIITDFVEKLNINLIDLIENNNVDIITYFLENELLDPNENNALEYCIVSDKVEMVKILLKNPKINVNAENDDGFTAITLAVSCNNTEIAKVLLENLGVDVNIEGEGRYTALTGAIHGDNIDIVKLLLKYPTIDVNKPGIQGYTPLIMAISQNSIEITKILLEDPKIDVNLPDRDEKLPIFRSLEMYDRNSDLTIIKLLLKRKDIDLKTSGFLKYLKDNAEKYQPILTLIYKWKFVKKKFIKTKQPKNLKNLPLQFYPPKNWTQWQKLCYTIHGLPKNEMMEQVNQLRLLAKKANIFNYETLTPTALCVELAKSFQLYNDEIKKTPKVTCKNDHDLLFDDFSDMLPEQIMVDEHGYCFSFNEMEELIKYGKHPYTNAPLKDVKIKGQPIIDYYNSGQKNQLHEIHKLYSSLENELKQETVFEELLVDLINESPDSSSTKYFSAVQLGKYDNKQLVRNAILNSLMLQDLSIENRDILVGLFGASNYTDISYIDFMKKLIEYINQMPSSNKETAKFLILELFKSHPPT